MIKQININNFQSHKNTSIELHENINVITGLSDSGKSGFIRAIDSIVRKAPFYPKYGSKSGDVEIIKDTSIISRHYDKTNIQKCPTCKIKIEKECQVCENCGELIPTNSSSDYYMIDGVKHEKFGAKLPDYIQEKIRINPINFIDKEIFINLSKQHDDFFFIGSSYDNLRNKMISSLIVDSDKVDELIKTLNSEKATISESLKVTNRDLETYKNKLSDSSIAYAECEAIALEIQLEQTKLSELVVNMDKLLEFKTMINELNAASGCADIIRQLSDKLTNTCVLLSKISSIDNEFAILNNLRNALILLNRFDNIESLSFDNRLIADIDSLISSGQSYLSINKLKSALVILNRLNGLELEPFDIDIDGIITNTKLFKSLTDIKQESSSIEQTISENKTTINKIWMLQDKLNTDICEQIDDSICPIIKDKYCEKCIKVLKDEYNTRT